MSHAVRRRGVTLLAWCALVGALAASGPLTAAEAVEPARPRWWAAAAGAAIAGGVARLGWPRLARLPAVADWGRTVVVVLAASFGALTAAAMVGGAPEPAAATIAESDADTASGGTGPSRPAAPASGGEGRRWTDVGGLQGAAVLTFGLALLVAAAVYLGRQSELRAVPATPTLLRSDLTIDDDDDQDADEVAAALARTRVALLADDEPRRAIRAAYRQLLTELDAIGLGRRGYEAPGEYLTRCCRERRLPEAPMRSLTEVFELARFSEHTLDDRHVRLAEGHLRDAGAALGDPARRRSGV